jgi:twitching motility protein PilU
MYKDGKIELEEALRKADSRDGLAHKIRLAEGATGEHDPYADMYGTANQDQATAAFYKK